MTVSIGADPELFIFTKQGDFVPGYEITSGTKEDPEQIDNGCALQYDNVMLEFNIPPAKTPGEFCSSVTYVRRHLRGRGFSIGNSCETVLPDGVEQDRRANIFGCSPDFDAYQMGAQTEPLDEEILRTNDGHVRWAGGHIHLGYNKTMDLPDFVAARLCDLLISCRYMAHARDSQRGRRQYYGQPGRYRPKEYGIEYRTMGNGWVCAKSEQTKDVAMYAFQTAELFDRAADSPEMLECVHELYMRTPWETVMDAITRESQGLCARLADDVERSMDGILWAHEPEPRLQDPAAMFRVEVA